MLYTTPMRTPLPAMLPHPIVSRQQDGDGNMVWEGLGEGPNPVAGFAPSPAPPHSPLPPPFFRYPWIFWATDRGREVGDSDVVTSCNPGDGQRASTVSEDVYNNEGYVLVVLHKLRIRLPRSPPPTNASRRCPGGCFRFASYAKVRRNPDDPRRLSPGIRSRMGKVRRKPA